MRLIDADDFFRNYPELAIEPYINAPTVKTYTEEEVQEIREEVAKQFINNERPKGEVNNDNKSEKI